MMKMAPVLATNVSGMSDSTLWWYCFQRIRRTLHDDLILAASIGYDGWLTSIDFGHTTAGSHHSRWSLTNICFPFLCFPKAPASYRQRLIGEQSACSTAYSLMPLISASTSTFISRRVPQMTKIILIPYSFWPRVYSTPYKKSIQSLSILLVAQFHLDCGLTILGYMGSDKKHSLNFLGGTTKGVYSACLYSTFCNVCRHRMLPASTFYRMWCRFCRPCRTSHTFKIDDGFQFQTRIRWRNVGCQSHNLRLVVLRWFRDIQRVDLHHRV